MALRTVIGSLLFSLAFPATAQFELFGELVGQHAMETNRLMAYEEIALEWKMSGKLQVYLNEGINNLLEDNSLLAETNFTELLKEDSSIWEAYYYRGISRKQAGKLAEARQDIHHVISTNNLVYECYLELGKIFQLEDNAKEAEKHYDKGIRIAPSKAIAYYLKANLQLVQKQYKEAAKYLNACLLRDSLFHDARIKLGMLEIVKKEQPEAGLPYFNRVLKSDSLQRYALLFRSIVNFKTDQQQSLADLNHVVRFSPHNTLVLYLRAVLLTELGDYRRSFKDFHQIIEITSESDNNFRGQQTWIDKKIDIQNAGAYTLTRVYGLQEEDGLNIRKAYCLIVIGKYEQSILSINETSVSDTDPLCLFLKGVASEHKGNHQDAWTYYNKALQLDNNILDAHKKRGIYEQELKQWDRSIADFTEALRINPETYVVYKIRGLSYFHARQYPRAINDFTRYLERDTANTEIIASRGMAYMNDGQHLKAALDFAESGNLHMLDYRELSNMMDSVLLLGDTTMVLGYLNQLTSSVPLFTEGYALKIKIFQHRQDWNAINMEIDRAIQYRRQDALPTSFSYLLTIKAITSGRGNRYDEAIIRLNEAIEYDKNNSLAFLERGRILLATGKNNKAITDLKKALSLGEDEARGLLNTIDN